MIYYLYVDKDNYLEAIATVGEGIEAELELADYDFSNCRLNAYKWENNALIFDADRYAEIEAEIVAQEKAMQETQGQNTGNSSVYDELAAAYKEGVQEA